MHQFDTLRAIDVNTAVGYCGRGEVALTLHRQIHNAFITGYTVLIKTATTEVHAARHRHRRDMLERGRLRRVIEGIDRIIAECEEAHLQGIKEVPYEIMGKTTRIYTMTRRAVKLTGHSQTLDQIMEIEQRRQIKITEVMDCLWSIQEVVFDLMLPWRTDLPEDIDPTDPWFSAA